jgi:hypothetical protein
LLFQLAPSVHRTDGTGSGLWPTPTVPNGGRSVAHVDDWRSNRTAYHNGKKVQVDLKQAVRMWPTPRTCSAMASNITPQRAMDKFPNLEREVARTMWPTPSAGDDRDRGNLSTPAIKRRVEKGKQLNLSMVVSEESGALNPEWVEWLMGFPAGWTSLESE